MGEHESSTDSCLLLETACKPVCACMTLHDLEVEVRVASCSCLCHRPQLLHHISNVTQNPQWCNECPLLCKGAHTKQSSSVESTWLKSKGNCTQENYNLFPLPFPRKKELPYVRFKPRTLCSLGYPKHSVMQTNAPYCNTCVGQCNDEGRAPGN